MPEFDLFSMISQKETTPKEVKKEVVKQKQSQSEAEKTTVSKKSEVKEKQYTYPFRIYLEGRFLETDHIFEGGNPYTEKEITSKMLEHQYYEFSGKVTFDYIEKDNVLVPIFSQHRKG